MRMSSATVRFEANESLHARARDVHDSAYGRQLRFLQHREQHTGVILSLGRFTDDNYEDLVQQSVNEVGDAVSATAPPSTVSGTGRGSTPESVCPPGASCIGREAVGPGV